ncbi:MAG: TonB-dependent siderophore receptor [Terracidiphilus sp.]|nr:TonB-dependent siderophore receptor [Terracidiphilus sp.]MDR3777276.1 TonB-dependent siderophore receptor [Terracidiphilus sp.]
MSAFATAVRTARPSSALHQQTRRAALALLCLLAPAAFAQQTPVTKAPAAPPVPRVTTTVVVHGEVKDDYLPDAISVGSLDSATLQETPLSATVVTHELLADQGARLLTDVVKNDASIGEDYAPVGYYSDFEIRGFSIDLATGLQINGMSIAGEQDVPLENKERVEFLKGLAGLESGVASAGGLINYVTKRPSAVKSVDVATDHRGSSYGAVDLGRFFGRQKQVGLRVNLAGEKIQSFLNDANGWRTAGAAAADWKLSQKATLKTDFEYQHKVERDGSGYQLLGGTVLPDLNHVFPSTMLGEQSWLKPNTFDTLNTSARLDYQLPRGWRAFAQGSYSHSLIDDNVIYAYGCYYEDACNVPGGPAPWFFAPDGTYDIYDYRNPGELRVNALGEALAMGTLKTGPVAHELAFGGELFHRNVDMPGAPPVGAPATVQNGAVYTYLGSENLFQPNVAYAIEDPHQSAGPVTLADFNHQTSALVQDRIHLPRGIQLTAGGRYTSFKDFNYTATKGLWLPQFAATYSPKPGLMFYGNYSVLLSLGPQAPWWAGGFYMAPYRTRQAEVGAKFQPAQRILVTTALFHMRAPFFYPMAIDDMGDQNFVMQGHESHDGIELNAEGKAASWLRLTASAAGIRAISNDTGTPAFDNKQVINVPHLRTAVFADVALPRLRGLHLMPGWSYTGRKEATRDDTVSVDSYNIFNLGARYMPGGEQGHVTLRLYADNIANKRYWKDTGSSYGDTFLWIGAPTTVRLSAHYTF